MKKALTNKQKLIISIVCVSIVFMSIILSIVLVNIKRFNITPNDTFDFNKHTQIIEVNKNDSYTFEGSIYNNGIQTFKDSSGKYGLFSYINNRVLVEATYNRENLVTLNTSSESGKSYFQLVDITHPADINVIDENGKRLENFNYDTEKDLTTTDIMTKSVNITGNKSKVNAKVINRFHRESVFVRSVSLDDSDIYYISDKYLYEVWNITTLDGIVYKNLYKVEDGKHKLIQTLNNEIGIDIDSKDLEIEFLTDGTPILAGIRQLQFDGESQILTTEIYDINLNLKGTSEISIALITNVSKLIKIGDIQLYQFIIPTTDKKYTYSETSTSGDTYYYNVETYKFNLKNGKLQKVDFNYVIQDAYDQFNPETTLLNVRPINKSKLGGGKNMLVNDRLQLKEIKYEFNYLTQVNKDRFIASLDGTSNFNLIDNNFNLISHMENYSQIFATKNSIIAQDSQYNYICNMDGIVIKKYSNSNVTYLKDEKYYLTTTEKATGSDVIKEYYLEQLGLRNESPLYSYSTANGYTIGENQYDEIEIVTSESFTLLLTRRYSSSGYTYEFYNMNGLKLITIVTPTISSTPNLIFSNSSNCVFEFAGHYYLMDR